MLIEADTPYTWPRRLPVGGERVPRKNGRRSGLTGHAFGNGPMLCPAPPRRPTPPFGPAARASSGARLTGGRRTAQRAIAARGVLNDKHSDLEHHPRSPSPAAGGDPPAASWRSECQRYVFLTGREFRAHLPYFLRRNSAAASVPSFLAESSRISPAVSRARRDRNQTRLSASPGALGSNTRPTRTPVA